MKLDVSKLLPNTLVAALVMPGPSTSQIDGPCTRIGLFIGRCRGRAILMIDRGRRQIRVRECWVMPDPEVARAKVEQWIAGQERDAANRARFAERGAMSEAITKVCDNPNCAWAHFMAKAPPANCPDCNGTGRVPDIEATLRAKVARLTEVLTRKDAAFDAHVVVTNQISANAIRVADENARLTSEVERLTKREQAAKPFVMACKEPGEFDTFCGSCWRYWTKDASGCADGCPRAAWLAGCKP